MKYRIWHKVLKRYTLPNECYIDQDGRINLVISSLEKPHRTAIIKNKDDFSVEYCSGSQDYFGKDIYEGDLVLHSFMASCAILNDGREIICLPGEYMAPKQDIYLVRRGGFSNKKILTSKNGRIGIFSDDKYKVIGNVNENQNIIEFLEKRPDGFEIRMDFVRQDSSFFGDDINKAIET